MFSRILKLEGLLLTGAGLTHLIYVSVFLDWSAHPIVMSLGASFFGLIYTLLGSVMIAGLARFLVPTLIVNAFGLASVLIAGETSPLYPIDPYLMIVDLVSIPLLIWLIWANWKAKR